MIHGESVHKDEQFEKNTDFKAENELKQVKENEDLWFYKCKICRLERESQGSIETHVAVIHKQKSRLFGEQSEKFPWVYKCRVCSYECLDKLDMAEHIGKSNFSSKFHY